MALHVNRRKASTLWTKIPKQRLSLVEDRGIIYVDPERDIYIYIIKLDKNSFTCAFPFKAINARLCHVMIGWSLFILKKIQLITSPIFISDVPAWVALTGVWWWWLRRITERPWWRWLLERRRRRRWLVLGSGAPDRWWRGRICGLLGLPGGEGC